jgi:phosphatidylglycerophosphate synthase
MEKSAAIKNSNPLADLPGSISEARRIAQPPEFSPSVTDIPYRAVSIYPSMVLARLGVTPNQITVFWVLLGLVGATGLGSGAFRIRLAGALLLQISYLLDFVDGEVARLERRSSKRGYLYDLAGHALIKTLLFLAVGYRESVIWARPEILFLAFSASVCISGGYALPFYAAKAGVRNQPNSESAPAGSPARSFRPLALDFVSLLFESPGLYAAVLLLAIPKQLVWVIVFYGLVGPLWFLRRAARYRYE